MITYEQAVQTLVNVPTRKLETEILDWEEAQGRIVAKEQYAQIDAPPFTNAAMDGYAVKAIRLARASKEDPVILTVGQAVFAGEVQTGIIQYDAIPIMTGATVPKGYDAVIRIEDTKKINTTKVAFFKKVEEGENIRKIGTDSQHGALLLKKGVQITPFNAMAAIAAGIRELEVWKKIRIGLLATGNELVSITTGEALADGQIYDSNTPALKAYLEGEGCEVINGGKITDVPSLLETKLHYFIQQNVDIIITVGAVSKGAKDFIPNALEQQGVDRLFHKVAIRPGKPIYAGILKQEKPILCLGFPGNPISSLVAARFFLYPYIQSLQGIAPEIPFVAKSITNYERPSNQLRYFLKAKYVSTQEGDIEVKILEGQESYRSYPLVQANCWVMVDENTQAIQEGDLVTCYLMQ